jgi:RNA polymerase sigma-70 factor (ECF subfamily)
LVRGLDRFDARSSFSTWAYRVATNAALDELRRRRRRPEPGMPLVESAAARPDGTFDQEIVARLDLDDALRSLPVEFRAPVVLRDLCALSYTEIAAVLEIPPGTVRSRISRGRAALAGMLRDSGPGQPRRPQAGPGGSGNQPGTINRPNPAHD